MLTFLTVVHVITCVFLILIVLLQSGKDAGMGMVSGSSQSVFGSSGGANFFTKLTAILAAVFLLNSIVITLLKSNLKSSVMEGAALPAATAPAATTTATPPAQATAPATTTGTTPAAAAPTK